MKLETILNLSFRKILNSEIDDLNFSIKIGEKVTAISVRKKTDLRRCPPHNMIKKVLVSIGSNTFIRFFSYSLEIGYTEFNLRLTLIETLTLRLCGLWLKFRIEIHSKPIKFIPIYTEISI